MAANGNLAENVLCYGSADPCPEQVELRAGPLAMVFEAGDLRRIRLGDHEIVRRIYVAVRDSNWGTVAKRISNLSIRAERTGFEIGYDVENREGEIDFRWAGRIAGDDTGTITFSMRGRAQSTFRKNRIGFCVLHPVKECAGRRCCVTLTDGTVEEGEFPLLISPHQPFRDFREIMYAVGNGTSVRIRFEGERFEMEDQRNWADASFKTYCTPLRLHFPVEVRAGTIIEQTVRLSLQTGGIHAVGVAAPKTISFSFDSRDRKPLPALGLGVTAAVPELNSRQIVLLRSLNLSHLRVDLDLAGGAWRHMLDRAIRESWQIGVPLEAAIILPGAATAELPQLADELIDVRPDVARWLVYNRAEKSTSSRSVRLVRDAIGRMFPYTPFFSGTNAYFAELNRKRPEPGVTDGICYSINPQVHAFDNDTLVENLAAQRDTVESARHFAAGLPIHVSPVTLRPRFNPNATGPQPEPAPGELPPQVDVRQMSLFGASWTVGSIKYLSEAGVAGITYYETCGCRGVMEAPSGSPFPGRFRSIPGGVFPLFHVLADAGGFRGGEVLRSESSAPLWVDGLVLCLGRQLRILLANMGREPRLVSLRTDYDLRTIMLLDATNAERAMKDPGSFRAGFPRLVTGRDGRFELSLGPFAVACIHGTLERP